MENNKNQKTITCSKKLTWFSAICFAASVIYGVLIFTYGVITESASDFTMPITLITVTGAVFGITVAAYLNKSRYENIIKIQTGYLKEKYTILQEMGVLTYDRAVQEVEDEFIDIESDMDNEKSMVNQEVSYNG